MDHATAKTSEMIAVCYRCFYRGPAHADPNGNVFEGTCPACDFALILETVEPSKERHIEDILARYSVRQGAPRLPGIRTHHGLDHPHPIDEVPARPRFFAVGTAQSNEDVPGWSAMVPKVAPRVPSTLEQATPVATDSPAQVAKRGLRAVEVLCVVLGALAAGVGAAFLSTAF